uniref:DB domain-containing protein n=1 Tax=Rhabditophanes sp. KR3021 TaxID=114890 RepID=A0AC35TTR2_9BILA
MKIIHIFFFTLLVIIEAKRDANQKLKACCARQKTADKDCKRKFCGFEVINKDNIMSFFNSCSSKGETVSNMWDCASSMVDHTECCKRNHVINECLPYCAVGKSVPTEYFKHLFCMQSFNGIRDCFREYLNVHPNIFGDK